MAIESVIWNFGGMLTESPFDAFNHFEAERGLPRNFLRGVNAHNHLNNAWARLTAVRSTSRLLTRRYARKAPG